MKQRWIKKMTALALVFIFTGQQIVTAQAPAPANELLRAKPLSLFSSRPSLELPAELGTVVDQFGDKPSLVLIQDAHGHTEAQRNTAELLRMLHKTEKFDALFLEGGIGNLKADRLKLLKIDSANLELADALLTQSDIGGAEHFLLGELIRAGKELPSYGLENPALYFKNLRNYQDTVSSESLSQKWLEGDWIRLRQNAAKVLNPALAEFYKQWMGYARQDDLMRALPVLEHASRKVIGVDFRDARAQIEWPMMTRVAELKRREKKLSAEKSEKEWMRLTDWVRSQGDTGKTLLRVLEDKEFFKKEAVWNERFKIASRRAFWEKLYEIMSPRGFDFKQYPNLSLWEGAKILESELEAEALMAEIRRLENSILEHLSGKPEEKEIIRQTKKNLLIEKLFTLQLTRDEFQVLSREKNVLNEPGLKNALHFYQAALSRDRVMAENAARIMAKNKIKKAVIIAGGFHTEAFTSSLKRKNISYAVVRPHLSVIESEHAYQDVMMGKLPSAPLAVSTLRAFSWINAPRYFNRLPAANRRRHDAVLKPLGAVRSRSEVRNEEEVTEKNSVRDGYSRSQRDRKLRFLVEDEDLIFDVLAKKPNRLFSFSEFLDEIGSERPKHFTPILLSMKGERETFKSKQDGINYRMIIRSDKGRVLSVGAIREQTVPIYQGLEKIILGNNTESSGLTEGERDFLNGLESSRNRPLALEALEFIISMFDQKEIITNEKTREFVLKLDEALTDDTPIYKFLNENGKLIRRLKPRGGGKKADDQNGQAEPASKLRKLDQKFYNLSELEEWILKDFVLFPLFRDNPTRIDLYEKLAKRKGDLRAAFDKLAEQGFMLKKTKGKTGIANTYEITDLGERMEALISARSEARAAEGQRSRSEVRGKNERNKSKMDDRKKKLLLDVPSQADAAESFKEIIKRPLPPETKAEKMIPALPDFEVESGRNFSGLRTKELEDVLWGNILGSDMVYDLRANQAELRTQTIKIIQEKIERAVILFPEKNNLKEILAQKFEHVMNRPWLTFDGLIAKVAHMTAKEDKADEYILLAQNKENGNFYVAKEVFSDIPSPELIALLVFKKIAADIFSDDEINRIFNADGMNGNKTAQLDKTVHELLARRTVHYQVIPLVRAIFEAHGIVSRMMKEPEKYSEQAVESQKRVAAKKIEESMRVIISENSAALRTSMVKPFKNIAGQMKGLPVIESILDDAGVWSALEYQNLQAMRYHMFNFDLVRVLRLNHENDLIENYLASQKTIQEIQDRFGDDARLASYEFKMMLDQLQDQIAAAAKKAEDNIILAQNLYLYISDRDFIKRFSGSDSTTLLSPQVHLAEEGLEDLRGLMDLIEPYVFIHVIANINKPAVEAFSKLSVKLNSLKEELGKKEKRLLNRSEIRSNGNGNGNGGEVSIHERLLSQIIYDRYVAFKGSHAGYKPQLFESEPKILSPKDPAFRVIRDGMIHYKRDFESVDAQNRFKKMLRKTTIMAVDLPSVFFHDDPKNPLTRIMQISFRRRTIMLSKKLLESLDSSNLDVQEFIADVLDIGQKLLDKYDEYLNKMDQKGATRSIVSEGLHEAYAAINLEVKYAQSQAESNIYWGQYFESHEHGVSLHDLDLKLRDEERKRIQAAELSLTEKASAVQEILKDWRESSGYKTVQVQERQKQIAELLGSKGDDSSYENIARIKLIELAHDLQKLAFSYEHLGHKERAPKYYEMSLKMLKATQKIDQQGFFPIQEQEEIIYFMMRSGDLEGVQREINRLLNIEYVPAFNRDHQRDVHQLLVPLWAQEAALDLLYKLQFYKSINQSKKMLAVIRDVESQLVVLYRKSYDVEQRKESDQQEKFGVNMITSRNNSLARPFRIFVQEFGDIIDFSWQRQVKNENEILVMVTASMLMASMERPRPIGKVYFSLLRDPETKVWHAEAKAIEDKGQVSQPLKVTSGLLSQYPYLGATLLRLALKLTVASNIQEFHLTMDPDKREEAGVFIDTKHHSGDPHVVFNNLSKSLLVLQYAKLAVNVDGSKRSEVRSKGVFLGYKPEDERLAHFDMKITGLDEEPKVIFADNTEELTSQINQLGFAPDFFRAEKLDDQTVQIYFENRPVKKILMSQSAGEAAVNFHGVLSLAKSIRENRIIPAETKKEALGKIAEFRRDIVAGLSADLIWDKSLDQAAIQIKQDHAKEAARAIEEAMSDLVKRYEWEAQSPLLAPLRDVIRQISNYRSELRSDHQTQLLNAEQFKQIRKDLKLSRYELGAKLFNVDRYIGSHVYDWEKGLKQIPEKMQRRAIEIWESETGKPISELHIAAEAADEFETEPLEEVEEAETKPEVPVTPAVPMPVVRPVSAPAANKTAAAAPKASVPEKPAKPVQKQQPAPKPVLPKQPSLSQIREALMREGLTQPPIESRRPEPVREASPEKRLSKLIKEFRQAQPNAPLFGLLRQIRRHEAPEVVYALTERLEKKPLSSFEMNEVQIAKKEAKGYMRSEARSSKKKKKEASPEKDPQGWLIQKSKELVESYLAWVPLKSWRDWMRPIVYRLLDIENQINASKQDALDDSVLLANAANAKRGKEKEKRAKKREQEKAEARALKSEKETDKSVLLRQEVFQGRQEKNPEFDRQFELFEKEIQAEITRVLARLTDQFQERGKINLTGDALIPFKDKFDQRVKELAAKFKFTAVEKAEFDALRRLYSASLGQEVRDLKRRFDDERAERELKDEETRIAEEKKRRAEEAIQNSVLAAQAALEAGEAAKVKARQKEIEDARAHLEGAMNHLEDILYKQKVQLNPDTVQDHRQVQIFKKKVEDEKRLDQTEQQAWLDRLSDWIESFKPEIREAKGKNIHLDAIQFNFAKQLKDAQLLMAKGQLSRAVDLFEKLAGNDYVTESIRVKAFIGAVNAYRRKGDFELAAVAADAGLELYPNQPDLLKEQASLQKRRSEARVEAAKKIESLKSLMSKLEFLKIDEDHYAGRLFLHRLSKVVDLLHWGYVALLAAVIVIPLWIQWLAGPAGALPLQPVLIGTGLLGSAAFTIYVSQRLLRFVTWWDEIKLRKIRIEKVKIKREILQFLELPGNHADGVREILSRVHSPLMDLDMPKFRNLEGQILFRLDEFDRYASNHPGARKNLFFKPLAKPFEKLLIDYVYWQGTYIGQRGLKWILKDLEKYSRALEKESQKLRSEARLPNRFGSESVLSENAKSEARIEEQDFIDLIHQAVGAGIEVPLRPNNPHWTAHLNPKFIEARREDFLQGIRQLMEALEQDGRPLESGLSYIHMSAASNFHLEQGDSLILMAIGSVLGVWTIITDLQVDGIGNPFSDFFPILNRINFEAINRSEARAGVTKLSLKDTKLNLIDGALNFWTLIPEPSGNRERIMSAFRNPLMPKRFVLPGNYQFTRPEDLLTALDRLSGLRDAPHIAGIIIDWDAFGSWQQRIVSKIKKLDKTGKVVLIAVGNKSPGKTDSASVIYYKPFGFTDFADDLSAALKTKPLVPRSSQGLPVRTGAKFLAFGKLGEPQQEIKPQPIPFAELKANEGKQVRLELGIKLGRDAAVKGVMDVFIASVSKKSGEKAEVVIDRVFIPKTIMYAKGDLLYVRSRAQEMNWHLSIGVIPTEQDFVIYSVKPLPRSEARQTEASKKALKEAAGTIIKIGANEFSIGWPFLVRQLESIKNTGQLPSEYWAPLLLRQLDTFAEDFPGLHLYQETAFQNLIRALEMAEARSEVRGDEQLPSIPIEGLWSESEANTGEIKPFEKIDQQTKQTAALISIAKLVSNHTDKPNIEPTAAYEKFRRIGFEWFEAGLLTITMFMPQTVYSALPLEEIYKSTLAEYKDPIVASILTLAKYVPRKEDIDNARFADKTYEKYKGWGVMPAAAAVLVLADIASQYKVQAAPALRLKSEYERFLQRPFDMYQGFLAAKVEPVSAAILTLLKFMPDNTLPSVGDQPLDVYRFTRDLRKDSLFAALETLAAYMPHERLSSSESILDLVKDYAVQLQQNRSEVRSDENAKKPRGVKNTKEEVRPRSLSPQELEKIAQQKAEQLWKQVNVMQRMLTVAAAIEMTDENYNYKGFSALTRFMSHLTYLSARRPNARSLAAAAKLVPKFIWELNSPLSRQLVRTVAHVLDHPERLNPEFEKIWEMFQAPLSRSEARVEVPHTDFDEFKLADMLQGGLYRFMHTRFEDAKLETVRDLLVFVANSSAQFQKMFPDEAHRERIFNEVFNLLSGHLSIVLPVLVKQAGALIPIDILSLALLRVKGVDSLKVVKILKQKGVRHFNDFSQFIETRSAEFTEVFPNAKIRSFVQGLVLGVKRSEARNAVNVKDVVSIIKNAKTELEQREEAVRSLAKFPTDQLARFEAQLLDFANMTSNPLSLRAMIIRVLRDQLRYSENKIPEWFRSRQAEMLENIKKAKSASKPGVKHQLIKKIDDAWVESPEESIWLLDNIRPYLDGNATGDAFALVKESIHALGIIGPPAGQFGAADVLETLLRNTERKWKIESDVEWALSRIKSDARSEARGREEFEMMTPSRIEARLAELQEQIDRELGRNEKEAGFYERINVLFRAASIIVTHFVILVWQRLDLLFLLIGAVGIWALWKHFGMLQTQKAVREWSELKQYQASLQKKSSESRSEVRPPSISSVPVPSESARSEARSTEAQQLLNVVNEALTRTVPLYAAINKRLHPESVLREPLYQMVFQGKAILVLHAEYLALLRDIRDKLDAFLAGQEMPTNKDIEWIQNLASLDARMFSVPRKISEMGEDQLSAGERQFLIGRPEGKWWTIIRELEKTKEVFNQFYWSPEVMLIRLKRYSRIAISDVTIKTEPNFKIILSRIDGKPFANDEERMYGLADYVGIDFLWFESERHRAVFHDKGGKLHSLLSRSEARISPVEFTVNSWEEFRTQVNGLRPLYPAFDGIYVNENILPFEGPKDAPYPGNFLEAVLTDDAMMAFLKQARRKENRELTFPIKIEVRQEDGRILLFISSRSEARNPSAKYETEKEIVLKTNMHVQPSNAFSYVLRAAGFSFGEDLKIYYIAPGHWETDAIEPEDAWLGAAFKIGIGSKINLIARSEKINTDILKIVLNYVSSALEMYEEEKSPEGVSSVAKKGIKEKLTRLRDEMIRDLDALKFDYRKYRISNESESHALSFWTHPSERKAKSEARSLEIVNLNAKPDLKAVLFDFDGTLSDTLELQYQAFGRLYHWIVNAKSEPNPSKESLAPGKAFLDATMGKLASTQIEMMMAEGEKKGVTFKQWKEILKSLASSYEVEAKINPLLARVSRENLVLAFSLLYEVFLLDDAEKNPPQPLPGVLDFIRALREQGVSLYVGTGTVQSLPEKILKAWGVRDSFEDVYGTLVDQASPFPRGKADMLEKIRKVHGLAKNKVAIFGDGAGDVIASWFHGNPAEGKDKKKFIAIGITKSNEALAQKLINNGADFLIPSLEDWTSYWQTIGLPVRSEARQTVALLPEENEKLESIRERLRLFTNSIREAIGNVSTRLGFLHGLRTVEIIKFSHLNSVQDFEMLKGDLESTNKVWDLFVTSPVNSLKEVKLERFGDYLSWHVANAIIESSKKYEFNEQIQQDVKAQIGAFRKITDDFGSLTAAIILRLQASSQNIQSRSEVRGQQESALEVSKEMTAKIVARGMEWLVPMLFAAEDTVSSERIAKEIAVLSQLFQNSAIAIAPADLLAQMEDDARKQYIEMIKKAAGVGPVSQKIIFAGKEAAALAEVFSGYDLFKNSSQMHQLVQTDSADENILAERMKNKAVSASFENLDETQNLSLIPAFKISTEEFAKLSSHEQLQYMSHLTQLQLLTAEALKDQLSDKSADRVKVMRDFLTKAGIQFTEEGGFLKPSAQSLIAADLTQLTQAYQLTSKSA